MLSNAYFLAKFRFDTAENESAKILQIFARLLMLLILLGRDRGPRAENRRGASEWSAVRHRRSVAAAVGAQAAGVR